MPAEDRPLPPFDQPLPGLTRVDPVFDGSVLADFLGTDSAAIASVLRTFLASMGHSMVGVQAAIISQDAAGLSELAHRAKGAAMVVGAPGLAQAARCLEQSAQLGDLDQVMRDAGHVQMQWQALQADAQLQNAIDKA